MLGTHHHHHHQSLREQLQFTTTTATSSATHSNVTTPGAARTIFSRFGIRKPSIVSVSSTPQPMLTTGAGGTTVAIHSSDVESAGVSAGATARTFSLDDLLRPPPRRTPSPRKKRNNSTPTKPPPATNAAEKKLILQKLLGKSAASAAAAGHRDSIALSDLMGIESRDGSGGHMRETTLSESPEILELANDAKLEKKVTFARLLNKVSAEMSSSSDGTAVPGASLQLAPPPSAHPLQSHRRTSSMPPSPSGLQSGELQCGDGRLVATRGSVGAGGGISSSTQSSDSMSSSDLQLQLGITVVDQHPQPQHYQQPHSTSAQHHQHPVHHQRYGSAGSASLTVQQPIVSGKSPLRPKVSSADSLLTIFRNFAGQRSGPSASERSAVSPSSSLNTSSSPHDDMLAAGDDDSSTSSSLHTPVSFNSMSNGGITFEATAMEMMSASDAADGDRNTDGNQMDGAQQTSNGGGCYLLPMPESMDLPANINQCLSPIRELPTPMPSPAPTPMMQRQHSFAVRFGARKDPEQELDDGDEQLQIERNVSVGWLVFCGV